MKAGIKKLFQGALDPKLNHERHQVEIFLFRFGNHAPQTIWCVRDIGIGQQQVRRIGGEYSSPVDALRNRPHFPRPAVRQLVALDHVKYPRTCGARFSLGSGAVRTAVIHQDDSHVRGVILPGDRSDGLGNDVGFVPCRYDSGDFRPMIRLFSAARQKLIRAPKSAPEQRETKPYNQDAALNPCSTRNNHTGKYPMI